MKELNEYLNLEGIEALRKFAKSTGRIKEINKNEFLFTQDVVCKYIGYIEVGAFRYLAYTSEGKEQIIGYSFENDFTADYISFMHNKPAVANAQAIRDSTVWIITQNEVMDFFENYTHNNFRSELAEVFLGDIYNRLLSFYCDTSEERYLKLITKYPLILDLITLKEIASFIKVTPETLSRIRKKLSLNESP